VTLFFPFRDPFYFPFRHHFFSPSVTLSISPSVTPVQTGVQVWGSGGARQVLLLRCGGVPFVVRPAGPLDRTGEIEGMVLEGLVAQHLRAWVAYRGEGDHLYYWRTKSGGEVDFVMYGPTVFAAIVVKRATNVHGKDLTALQAFREDYPEAGGKCLSSEHGQGT